MRFFNFLIVSQIMAKGSESCRSFGAENENEKGSNFNRFFFLFLKQLLVLPSNVNWDQFNKCFNWNKIKRKGDFLSKIIYNFSPERY